MLDDDSVQIHFTSTPEQTIALGVVISRQLQPPCVVLLTADLGGGKTTLAKGLISGLGAAPPEEVLSPTFSLIHEYDGPPKVYHIDLYRLDRNPEVETLGLDEIWDEEAIVIVEWGEKFEPLLPAGRMEIHILDQGGDEREIRIRQRS
jgi:tRNA threonylcarbamoyladenosine biosynthesis protein TsaE